MSGAWNPHALAVQDYLEVGNGAIGPSEKRLLGRRWSEIKDWWTGTSITAAWESVQGAEAELAEIESEEHVRSRLPRLWAWMQQAMTPAERQPYKKIEGWISDRTQPIDKALIRGAYQDVIRANNEVQASMRAFRNLLLAVSAGLFLLLVGIGTWHALNPAFIALCHDGQCPGGSTHPVGETVFEVELVGGLAGLLGGAFLLRSFKNPPSRYNLLPGQILLKPVAGAATAIIAILLLQAGVIVETTDASSTTTLLGYAALFGFSQELLTRLVDKRAGALANEQEEGKSSAGKESGTTA
ncbi:MAG TPA: hypothetical protein VKG38_04945 [Solirubrobacteraceae bacterium]|nr:hypothetical protein [Solirubrobacteraceae bacterium]